MPGRTDAVTIYCCGSGQHRGSVDKDAIAYLYAKTQGARKFIVDGPGGADIQKTEEILKMVESGKDASTGLKIWQSKDSRRAKSWADMLKASHKGGAWGGATGVGTADNVIMCLQWLWLEWHKQRFVDINLAGFSRGGVTCIFLAHAIQEAGFATLGPIRVNIFTFDPVPGGLNDFKVKGTFEETGRAGSADTLAACVASYRSILQENIKKWDYGILPKDKTFKCVVPNYLGKNPSRTPRELYPMPGGHGDSQSYTSDKGTGKIGLHLAQTFLEDHGTAYACDHKLTKMQLIEEYAMVRAAYAKLDGGTVGKKKASTHRKDIVVNPFRVHPYFVNSHHATLMYQNVSDLARLVDEPGAKLSESRKKFLMGALPKTYYTLHALGYMKAS